MGLGREIHYRIDFPDKRVRKLAVSDIPFNEPVSLVATKILDVPQVPGICELVEVDHLAVGFVDPSHAQKVVCLSLAISIARLTLSGVG